MRTVFMLVHKTTYGSERKILRAYEEEADAKDMVKLMEGIVSGTLEVQPVDLFEVVKVPDGWRKATPAPAFMWPIDRLDMTPRSFDEPDESALHTPGGVMRP